MQAMREVTGPIVATSLVLAGVFIPIAFISGLTGMFYKQFALTIVIATFISMINSLTLSPALSALLLQGRDHKPDMLTRGIDTVLGWFFHRFNAFFHRGQNTYARSVHFFGRRRFVGGRNRHFVEDH